MIFFLKTNAILLLALFFISFESVSNKNSTLTGENNLLTNETKRTPVISKDNSVVNSNTNCTEFGNGSIIAAIDLNGLEINGVSNEPEYQLVSSCNAVLFDDAVPVVNSGFRLTDDLNNQFGRVTLGNKIDISQPFRFDFKLYLGDEDAAGADGVALTFHRDPRGQEARGRSGGNLGVGDTPTSSGTNEGVSPSFTVEFDTWQDVGLGDPSFDHCNLFLNGNIDIPVTSPVRIEDGEDNVENGDTLDVTLVIKPIASGQLLQLYVNESLRFEYADDIVNNVFGGESYAFALITAATGGASNEHALSIEPYLDQFDFTWYNGPNIDPNKIRPENTASICGLLAGQYTLVVTDRINGLSSRPVTYEIEDFDELDGFRVSTFTSNVVCSINESNGPTAYNGNITVSNILLDDFSSYAFQWYRGGAITSENLLMGETSNTIDNIVDGHYQLLITNSETGCERIVEHMMSDFSSSININAVSLVSALDVTTCEGSSLSPNGGIQLNESEISGGTGNYHYQYYFGASVNSANLIIEGVDIFTQKGTVSPNLTVDVSGSSSPFISGLNEGIYTLVITDEGTGCQSQPISVEISEDIPTSDFVVSNLSNETRNNTVCDDLLPSVSFNGQISVFPVGSSISVYSFQWYQGGRVDPVNLIPGSASNVLSNISGGTYTLLATNLTTQCETIITHSITDELSAPIIVEPLMLGGTITSEVGDVDHPNGSSSINSSGVTGSSGNLAFQYYFGNSVDPANLIVEGVDIFTQKGLTPVAGAVSVTGISTGNISGLNEGDYTLVIVDLATGCSSIPGSFRIEDNLQVNPLINISTTSSNTFCDNSGNSGDGTLSIEINEQGALQSSDPNLFQITWYRGENTDLQLADALGTAVVGGGNNTSLSGLSPGAYTVHVQDNSGCTGCESTATYRIESEMSLITIDETINVTSSDNFNCTNPNGFIQINSVFENEITNADLSNYSFTWRKNSNEVVIGVNSGIGTNNRIEDLEGGSYTIEVTNINTGCISGLTAFTVNDFSSNPFFQLNSKEEDTYCDNGILSNQGNGSLSLSIFEGSSTPSDINDFTVIWYRGSNSNVTNEIFPNDPSNLRGTASQLLPSELTGLSSGEYTVSITKNSNPNNGCSNIQTFTIDSEQPLVSISRSSTFPRFLSPGIIQNQNENCVNPNGFIEVTAILEDLMTVDVNTANYGFQWFNANGDDITATAVNGSGIANKIENLSGGTYSTIATNLTTGCSTGLVEFTIEDVSELPEITLSNSSSDTFCNASMLEGNGSLAIDITEDGAAANLSDYDVTWYRGLNTDPMNEIFPNDPGNLRGTAITVSMNSIEGLSVGDYTVVVSKLSSTTPNAGCTNTASFSIQSGAANLSIAINSSPNTLDESAGADRNGFITVNSVIENGVFISDLSNYSFQWFNPNGTPVALSNVVSVGSGTNNKIEDVASGTYDLEFSNLITGCDSERISISIEGENVQERFVWTGNTDTNWSTPTNWNIFGVPSGADHVTIPPSTECINSPTITEGVNIQNLVIESDGVLNVMSSYLEIAGFFVSNGKITIAEEASVIGFGSHSGFGVAEVSTTLRGDNALQIISFPVNSFGVIDELNASGEYLMFEYDNATQTFPPVTEDFLTGEAVFLASNVNNNGSGVPFTISDSRLNIGTVQLTSTIGLDGFTLVGNPYPSAIDASMFFADPDNMNTITGTAYLWNDGGTNVDEKRGGDYVTINSVGVVAGTVNSGNGVAGAKPANDFDGSFHKFQGFFVKIATPGSVTFRPSMQLRTNGGPGGFFREEVKEEKSITLSMSDGKRSDQLMIDFHPKATDGFDYSMDASKLIGNSDLSFYSLDDDVKYAIQALPLQEVKNEILLGFITNETKNLKLKVDQLVNESHEGNFFLKNIHTGQLVLLDNEIEVVIPAEAGQSDGLYSIVFLPNLVTSIEKLSENNFIELIKGNEYALTVKYQGNYEQVTIYDLNGRSIFSEKVDFQEEETTINTRLKLHTIYMLSIDNQTIKFSLK